MIGIGVYRAEESPALDGIYFNADLCTGEIRGLQRDGNGIWQFENLLDTALQPTGAGQDANNELYLAMMTGEPDAKGAGSLWKLVAADKVPEGATTVPLGFRTDSTGKRVLSFPRIIAVVDGDTLQLLFDTGATGFLSPQAVAALGDSAPSVRATSFITSEVLTRWRQRHPDWRVLDNADQTIPGMRMIEVPRITVAGSTVGPVWFTERPDRNFHEFMSQFMDRRVDGALGGNAFRFFRITVDYPAAVAHFMPATPR